MEQDKTYLEEVEEVVEVKFCFCDRCILLAECVTIRNMSICNKCYKELYAFN